MLNHSLHTKKHAYTKVHSHTMSQRRNLKDLDDCLSSIVDSYLGYMDLFDALKAGHFESEKEVHDLTLRCIEKEDVQGFVYYYRFIAHVAHENTQLVYEAAKRGLWDIIDFMECEFSPNSGLSGAVTGRHLDLVAHFITECGADNYEEWIEPARSMGFEKIAVYLEQHTVFMYSDLQNEFLCVDSDESESDIGGYEETEAGGDYEFE